MTENEPCPVCGVAWCSYCGFTLQADPSGVVCKSGIACPFHGLRVKYLAPPEVFR